MFQVEGDMASNGSILNNVHTPLTPPDDIPTPPSSFSMRNDCFDPAASTIGWMEFWDYVGGASFRGFVVEDNGEKSLFVFFDDGLDSHDLKPR